MKMRWVACVGILMVGVAIHLRTGPSHGLAFAGTALFLLAGWCAFVDGQ
jgi:hypothetical protein